MSSNLYDGYNGTIANGMKYLDEMERMSPEERLRAYERECEYIAHSNCNSNVYDELQLEPNASMADVEEVQFEVLQRSSRSAWEKLSSSEQAAIIEADAMVEAAEIKAKATKKATKKASIRIAKSNYAIAQSMEVAAKTVLAGLSQIAQEIKYTREIQECYKLLDEIEQFDKELMTLKKFKEFYSNVDIKDVIHFDFTEEEKQFLCLIFRGEALETLFDFCIHELQSPFDFLDKELSQTQRMFLTFKRTNDHLFTFDATIPKLGITLPYFQYLYKSVKIGNSGVDFVINGKHQETEVKHQLSSVPDIESPRIAFSYFKGKETDFVHTIETFVSSEDIRFLMDTVRQQVGHNKYCIIKIERINQINSCIDRLNFVATVSAVKYQHDQLKKFIKKCRVDSYFEQESE